MPQIHFEFSWPDGTVETAYSPSLVVKDYLKPGEVYTLDDFLERTRVALQIASERVEARYGQPCSLALRQLKHLELVAARYHDYPDPRVQLRCFRE